MTSAYTKIAAAVFLLAPLAAAGADIVVSGLFAGKAILQIDGGAPRTLSAGETTPEGVKLLAADSESATIEYQGRRETLTVGGGTRLGAASQAGGGGAKTTLTADARGHFIATGTINGQSVRFLVDTGASMITLSAAEARRLGVSYLSAPQAAVQTANGTVRVSRVKLDSVTVGAITAYNVDAVVTGGSMPVALLGMSFLNRIEMRRDGDTMTLVRRY
jgi:aspartyl protease family protein